uniref:Uncharacterized protein n=1 Tax=Setaria digitata TaxID=48799 RepID=A0A915PKE5_9BILA
MINGRHHRIEDLSIRQHDGSLLIQRVLKLTDLNPLPVASMILEIPPEEQNATKLYTLRLPLNHSKVLIPYIQAMIAASFAFDALQMEKTEKIWNILEFVIELEQEMYELAKKYFGLIEDERQQVIIEDGFKYLQEIKRETKFDVIFIDACYNQIIDDVICPVEAFKSKENLKIIKQALNRNGIVILSILAFEDDKVKMVLACGEYRRNKAIFTKKLRETYRKFEFDTEPNVE